VPWLVAKPASPYIIHFVRVLRVNRDFKERHFGEKGFLLRGVQCPLVGRTPKQDEMLAAPRLINHCDVAKNAGKAKFSGLPAEWANRESIQRWKLMGLPDCLLELRFLQQFKVRTTIFWRDLNHSMASYKAGVVVINTKGNSFPSYSIQHGILLASR